jgi:isopenicillin N synthase-like dioxygenase
MTYHEDKHFYGYLPPKSSELLKWFHYGYDNLQEHPLDDESIPLINRIIHGKNKWPSEPAIPGFKEVFKAHQASCDFLNRTLQHSIAEMLGLPEDTFEDFFWKADGSHAGFSSTRGLFDRFCTCRF